MPKSILRQLFILTILYLFLFNSLSLNISESVSLNFTYGESYDFVYENITIHEGDLTLTNNDVLLIKNCEFFVTGHIFLKDNSTLIIKNTFLRTLDEPLGGIWMNGRSSLFITDSSLNISYFSS